MVYAKDIEVEQVLEHNWHDIVYDVVTLQLSVAKWKRMVVR